MSRGVIQKFIGVEKMLVGDILSDYPKTLDAYCNLSEAATDEFTKRMQSSFSNNMTNREKDSDVIKEDRARHFQEVLNAVHRKFNLPEVDEPSQKFRVLAEKSAARAQRLDQKPKTNKDLAQDEIAKRDKGYADLVRELEGDAGSKPKTKSRKR